MAQQGSGPKIGPVEIQAVLDRVWFAAMDLATSPDFRNADGELDEATHERYRKSVTTEALEQLAAAAGGSRVVKVSPGAAVVGDQVWAAG